MQRPISQPSTPGERSPDNVALPAAEVSSDQLWHQAIQATRQAATAAAELREALGAARGASPEVRGR